MSSAVISCERALLDGQRDARGVVGHHVGAFADRRRGLHLGVEGHAPVERRRLDFDLAGVLLVEVLDQRLHADAVAAAEEVPPDDLFLRLRRRSRDRSAPPRRAPSPECFSSLIPPCSVVFRFETRAGSRTPPRHSADRLAGPAGAIARSCGWQRRLPGAACRPSRVRPHRPARLRAAHRRRVPRLASCVRRYIRLPTLVNQSHDMYHSRYHQLSRHDGSRHVAAQTLDADHVTGARRKAALDRAVADRNALALCRQDAVRRAARCWWP